MTDLIAKLEAAEGPDEKLDGQIFRLLHQTRPDDDWWLVDDVWHLRDENDFVAWEPPPPFTSSLDVVLTLFNDAGDIMTALDGALELVGMRGYKIDDTTALQWEIRRYVLIAALRARGEG